MVISRIAIEEREGDVVLMRRDVEVLELASAGLMNKEIRKVLSFTESTMKRIWTAVFCKLGTFSKSEAVAVGFMYEVIDVKVVKKMRELRGDLERLRRYVEVVRRQRGKVETRGYKGW